MLSIKWVTETARGLGVDLIVFGGDFVHNPRNIDFTVYNMGYQLMREMALEAPIIAIRGNHDELGEFRNSSATYPLSGIPGITVVSEPETQYLYGCSLKFFPYSKSIPDHTKADIIFCHHDIMENMINGKSLGKHSCSEFNAPLVISGHYHKPGTFTTLNGRFVYGGALLPHSFVDEGDHEFGALLVDTDSLLVRKLPNPNVIKFLDIQVRDIDLDLPKSNCYHRAYVPQSLYKSYVRKVKDLSQTMVVHCDIIPVGSAETIPDKVVAEFSDSDLISKYVESSVKTGYMSKELLIKLGNSLNIGNLDIEELIGGL
jgi:DNA repair exonuclease SbcCD nuclease subunit